MANLNVRKNEQARLGKVDAKGQTNKEWKKKTYLSFHLTTSEKEGYENDDENPAQKEKQRHCRHEETSPRPTAVNANKSKSYLVEWLKKELF